MDEKVGYVAFVDVLGFTHLTGRETGLSEIKKYIETVSAFGRDDRFLQYVHSSDSVVITSPDDKDASYFAITKACSELFALLLTVDIPVRGAIACGPYIQHGNIVAGRPLVEAYKCEQSQEWAGIILTRSALEKVIREFGASFDAFRRNRKVGKVEFQDQMRWCQHVMPYQIPFRDPKAIEGVSRFEAWAILPVNAGANTPDLVRTSLDRSFETAERLVSLATDPSSQAKCQALKNFIGNARTYWAGREIIPDA